MNKTELQEKIIENMSGTEQFDEWDSLKATDPDYMMYSPLPVGYNTTSEQRFLMQNLLIGLTANSILDIGCGRADLYGFINDFYDNNIIYHGIDHNPLMIDLANRKYDISCLTGAFETTNLPVVDHVVANGVFTQRRCETEDDDLRKLLVDIDILYETATNMVSFNLLNPINNTLHEGFFYVHPGLIMDMLIEKYQNIVVRNNYSKDVYTVVIYKF
tara:strand:+ start:222 stop:869 length:648 start_codon:yes stop_codon:yes gene_type:complete